ncbi:hypothetical protein CEXT_475691 [Caerostris extrusa]|uniref:Uncharacterized protein n=1 Tax=Caerostris extrusa TaxID=172846 RepID=A0AAV4NBP7_CAEEX|nr:hypothetical protein CEXT_475691 [Caerostris extrusa]
MSDDSPNNYDFAAAIWESLLREPHIKNKKNFPLVAVKSVHRCIILHAICPKQTFFSCRERKLLQFSSLDCRHSSYFYSCVFTVHRSISGPSSAFRVVLGIFPLIGIIFKRIKREEISF